MASIVDREHQRRCPLQSLKAVTVQPDRFSERMALLAIIKQIETIQVTHCVQRSGRTYYGVAVCLRQFQSRIPTFSSRGPSAPTPFYSSEPHFQVERSFREFRKLRSCIHKHAFDCGFCSFCDDLLKYLYFSDSQPRLLRPLVQSEEKVRQMLSTFLNDLLTLTMRTTSASDRLCEGEESIPRRLADFLQIPMD